MYVRALRSLPGSRHAVCLWPLARARGVQCLCGVVGLSVFPGCGVEAPLATVEQSVKFTQSPLHSLLIRSSISCRASSGICCLPVVRGFGRGGLILTSVLLIQDLNLRIGSGFWLCAPARVILAMRPSSTHGENNHERPSCSIRNMYWWGGATLRHTKMMTSSNHVFSGAWQDGRQC